MASCSEETCLCVDGAAFKLPDFAGCHRLKGDGKGLGDGRGDGVNQALAGRNTSKQNIEPIIIGNYKTMNYFSQAASDVTIYLNTEENFEGQNHYRVDENGVIDLTKPFEEALQGKAQNPINGYCHYRTQITEGPQKSGDGADSKPTEIPYVYSNSDVNPRAKEEVDTPEYIDISKLQVPIECFLYPADGKAPAKKNTPVPPFLKRNRQAKCKPAATVTSSTNETDHIPSSSDDEVIFVKEFKAENEDSGPFNDPLDLSSTKTRSQFAPRRNPKRQVQLLKASTDLALKLSDADIYYGMSGNSFKDYYTETPRRPNRTTGAIFNPPTALTDVDYKEWPADGMHERPVFNNTTKKIDKFDIPKPRRGPAKNKEPAKPAPRKRRVARKMQKPKRADKSEASGINKEFAALTHGTLQEVVDYVLQVKEYNEVIRKRGESSTVPEDERDESEIVKHNKCMATITEILSGKRKEKNLVDAAELLADSCLLYSLANGVCHTDVARYFDNFKKGGTEE